jgi:hypothetical protein
VRQSAARWLLVCLAWLAAPIHASAFGVKAHRIHGELTWLLLSEGARAEVSKLLAGESLADVSYWADQIRDEQPKTAPWHYVNLPPQAECYDAARDCGDGQCIVARLEAFEKVLLDREADTDERRVALKWVVHLVADLHQPLHVSLLADRGGNDVAVTFFGQPTNLHRVFDVDLVERFDRDARSHAEELRRDLDPVRSAEWAKASHQDVANESWKLAIDVAYRHVDGKPIRSGDRLGRAYWLARSALVDDRLARAAVRLAALLERV